MVLKGYHNRFKVLKRILKITIIEIGQLKYQIVTLKTSINKVIKLRTGAYATFDRKLTLQHLTHKKN